MKYRAILTIDFADQKPNGYQKLASALLQNGWLRVERSAFAIETPELSSIWVAFALIPRQAQDAGILSTLTIQIQGSEDFARGRDYAAEKNHRDATREIMTKTFPEARVPQQAEERQQRRWVEDRLKGKTSK